MEQLTFKVYPKTYYGYVKGCFENLTFNPILPSSKPISPHYNLKLKIKKYTYRVNINIRSTHINFPNLKIFKTTDFQNDIINKKPFLKALSLSDGVYRIHRWCPYRSLRLDYLRGNYFPLDKLVIFEKDKNATTDLFNMINNIFQTAKQNNYKISFWGQIYCNTNPDGSIIRGIHDIHMNQGVKVNFPNAIYQDGALMVDNGTKIQLLMFVAFEDQCLQTDRKGNCIS